MIDSKTGIKIIVIYSLQEVKNEKDLYIYRYPFSGFMPECSALGNG